MSRYIIGLTSKVSVYENQLIRINFKGLFSLKIYQQYNFTPERNPPVAREPLINESVLIYVILLDSKTLVIVIIMSVYKYIQRMYR
jgi:hypothetical protein